MRTTDHVEQYRRTRNTDSRFDTTVADGMNGIFIMSYPKDSNISFFCIVSDGNEEIPWEHVSARARRLNGQGKWHERVPNWDELCFLKDLFWQPDEVVVQYHPKKENYVNIHPNVLHLWRFKGEMPTPPTICV